MLLSLPYAHVSTNCWHHQPLPTGVEDLERKVRHSDKWVTWTTRDVKESGENRGTTAGLRNSSPSVILIRLQATTSSQIASLFLHWFITFSKPSLVFSLLLDPSIYLILSFIFFSLQGMIGFFASHSFLLVCSRQMEKLILTLAKASFPAELQKNAS